MDINAGLIDQQTNGLMTRLRDDIFARIGKTTDEHRLKSAAFTVLCLQHTLSIDESLAVDSLTDGGNDVGVDAIHIGDVVDGEFATTLVQSKYSKNLEGKDGFPANSIIRSIQTVRHLFDPAKKLPTHPRLRERIAEVHSLILDYHIPEVRVLLCNNGRKWEANGEQEIEVSGLRAKDVEFIHVNHDKLVALLQKRKSIDAGLKLSGKAIVESFDYRRVLVGKLPVRQIRDLFDTYGDGLLDRNIRRYLGLRDNRVNLGIHRTLSDTQHRKNFYFFNNGITAVCTKFSHTALQEADWNVSIEALQIVNGGQTCKTIQSTIKDDPDGDYSKTHVLLRLYEISANEDEILDNITLATNSQNPVDVTDLKSNDSAQERLALGLGDLGFEYKRKRDDQPSSSSNIITSSVAAEAIMAVWRRRPNAAKFRRSKLFSDFYTEVFSDDIQASHVVLSVLIFRLVENERKRPKKKRPSFVPYASHFLAMVVADLLLQHLSLDRSEVSHQNVEAIRTSLENGRDELYEDALGRVRLALRALGIRNNTPLPRIAAQFRRGDLLDPLQKALSANPSASGRRKSARTGTKKRAKNRSGSKRKRSKKARS